ncbi:MAG TPA: hypothetical protein VGS18_01375, partial [Thermoplasmata archaeon]|nr:hypothetical protein [Thermoplasmata archaeon]
MRLFHAVRDLRHTEPEHAVLDDPRDQTETLLLVWGERIGRFHSELAVRAAIARDLHIEYERLGGREVRDGSLADLEGIPELGVALGALLQRESYRWGVRHGPTASTARVTRLAPGGLGSLVPSRTSIEDPRRGNAPRLRGLLIGREEVKGGLVPPKFLLETVVLLSETVVHLPDLVRLAKSAEELTPLLLRGRDVPLGTRFQRV